MHILRYICRQTSMWWSRPLSQIPQCIWQISYKAPFCNRFLLQNGVFWLQDVWLVHYGICVTGLLAPTSSSAAHGNHSWWFPFIICPHLHGTSYDLASVQLSINSVRSNSKDTVPNHSIFGHNAYWDIPVDAMENQRVLQLIKYAHKDTILTHFYPRLVLAFGYCHCLHLCVCVCLSVCQSLSCPRDYSGPAQARITKCGPKMLKTLVKVPIVL